MTSFACRLSPCSSRHRNRHAPPRDRLHLLKSSVRQAATTGGNNASCSRDHRIFACWVRNVRQSGRANRYACAHLAILCCPSRRDRNDAKDLPEMVWLKRSVRTGARRRRNQLSGGGFRKVSAPARQVNADTKYIW